ncbi:3'-5' exonuclease [Paracoccus litorisediminis]|uniref:3'-5' exonuclease n=1 Tax=Paracoccus litorisediminis TaxID=2006130 RepID=UPI001FE7D3B0|nr:3'-5' exonuclease [Paracoccus litorisediminis]
MPPSTGAEAGVPLKDENYLIHSTIHSAKGQEWKAVFVLNVVDGCIPSDLGTGQTADLEEERRLLYVAMTRAKDQLTLGVPLRFYVTHRPNAASGISSPPAPVLSPATCWSISSSRDGPRHTRPRPLPLPPAASISVPVCGICGGDGPCPFQLKP